MGRVRTPDGPPFASICETSASSKPDKTKKIGREILSTLDNDTTKGEGLAESTGVAEKMKDHH